MNCIGRPLQGSLLNFEGVDITLACTASNVDMLTVIPQDEVILFGIPFLHNFYESGANEEKSRMLSGLSLKSNVFHFETAGMFMERMVT